MPNLQLPKRVALLQRISNSVYTLQRRQMSVNAFKFNGNSTVCSKAYLGKQQQNHQRCAILAICDGESPVRGGFPTKRAISAGSGVNPWRYHEKVSLHVCLERDLLQQMIILGNISYRSIPSPWSEQMEWSVSRDGWVADSKNTIACCIEINSISERQKMNTLDATQHQ